MRPTEDLLSPPRREFIATLSRRPAPLSKPDELPLSAPARQRQGGIDLVRGLAMILMCLDHARDFVGAGGDMNPRNVTDTGMFLTRWITHFCAPVFILLAGVSAFLYRSRRGRTAGDVSRFLLTRGFWLVFLEFTLVRIGWTFQIVPDVVVLQVIWAIGASMVLLSALVWLPRWAVATFAAVVNVGHNALDGVSAESFDAPAWIWHLLHVPATIPLGTGGVMVLYPLIPWVAVMAAGYAMGPIFRGDTRMRHAQLAAMGCALTLGFVTLRVTNLYGDPQPWSPQEGLLPTLLSLLNCEKYPPSLLYLMMTLGPALLLLSVADTIRGWFADVLITFGRVPMMYYVAHLFLLHVIALVVWQITSGDVEWLFQSMYTKPQTGGLGLLGIYVTWFLAVAVLYPLCRWFADVKQRRREWWLSYL
jgi:uncharacterized membrane protein